MALRFLLVSLVAGLGFELPSGEDVSSWARSGRDWVGAKAAELATLRAEAGLSFACWTDRERDERPVAMPEGDGAGSALADVAFEVVVEGMASDFAADLADRSGPDFAPDAIAEGAPSVEPAALAWVDPEPAPPLVEAAPAMPAGDRAGRLTSAVRLTRQAIDAWASLIAGRPEAVATAR